MKLTLTVDPTKLEAPKPDGATPETVNNAPRQYLVEAAGWVDFKGGTAATNASVPYQAIVRAGSDRQAAVATGCAPGAGRQRIALEGTSAHPDPVVSALELLAENPAVGVRAIGAASNVGRVEDEADAQVFIGLALDEEWTTPAQGALSRVALSVTTENSERFVVYAEPYLPGRPDREIRGLDLYADVLTATLFDPIMQIRITPPKLNGLNALPPTKADTQLFFNNVVVLPMRVADVLRNGGTRLRIRPVLNYPLGGVNTASEVEFDVAGTVDLTTKGIENTPVHRGDAVELSYLTAEPPRLMLLHHNNDAQKRLQIVEPPSDGGVVRVRKSASGGGKLSGSVSGRRVHRRVPNRQ